MLTHTNLSIGEVYASMPAREGCSLYYQRSYWLGLLQDFICWLRHELFTLCDTMVQARHTLSSFSLSPTPQYQNSCARLLQRQRHKCNSGHITQCTRKYKQTQLTHKQTMQKPFQDNMIIYVIHIGPPPCEVIQPLIANNHAID